MTFKKAKKKLKKIAKGEYCLVRYKETYPTENETRKEYDVYINGYGLYEGETFEEAFAKLEKGMEKGKI